MQGSRYLALMSTVAVAASLVSTGPIGNGLVGIGAALASGGQTAAGKAHTVAKAAVGPVKPSGAGKPQVGDFGVDLAGMDKSVKPGDDFYGYVDGSWAIRTAIPGDKSSYGAFDVLADLSETRTHDILEKQKADPSSKMGIAYATYSDVPTIEAKGLSPIKPWFDRLKAVSDKEGYATIAAEATRDGIATPFRVGVGQDAKDPETYIVRMGQSGLGMPDRDYYLKADPKLADTKAKYQAHLARMLTLAGEPDGVARAKAIVDFETQIAQVSWTRIDSRDADKTYHKMPVAQLVESAPGFDFVAYLQGVGTPVGTVIVAQPTAVTGIAKLIAVTPIGVLRDQLMVRSLESYSDVLPTAFDKETFAFRGTVLSGTPEQEVRWKRAVAFTSGALSDDVSKLYVAQYFPPATKTAMDTLVKNIIAAMNVRIEHLTWMTPATKVKAHTKLAAFTPKIGYPSRWHDYSALTITPGDAYGNKLRTARWDHDDEIGHLGKPLQRWEWGMTPMTVNAYANPTMVEIVFPAAILQPPFFDPAADPAVNYGGIGAVIGHEMSHHFDDQGAKFDNHGRLAKWWTDEDVTHFNALEAKLVAEYDQYEPIPGLHVQGRLTLGENSADLAGLSCAYDAYHRSLNGKPAPVIDGLTGDQRFYMGWAQVWRRNYRDANLRQRLLTDPHSPDTYRANIVRNMDPWYAAFNPAATTKLFLAPDQRVHIW